MLYLITAVDLLPNKHIWSTGSTSEAQLEWLTRVASVCSLQSAEYLDNYLDRFDNSTSLIKNTDF